MITLNTGDKIPAIGLGTWKSAPGEVALAVKEAIAVGYRHIDCAHIYGNEAEIGEAFAEVFAGQVQRKDLWITSKLWNNAHKPERVRSAVLESLKNLQVDYLDLYLIHWPVHQVFTEETLQARSSADFIAYEEIALLDTWRELEALVDEGLIKNIGLSNYSIKKIESLLSEARISPAMIQVERHPYNQQTKLQSYCYDNGISFTAFSPLGSGDRPVRFKKDDEPVLLDHPIIKDIAKKHSAKPAQILISWAVATNTVVIPKSTNPTRIKENLAASKIVLDDEDLKTIKTINIDYRYVDGSFWCGEGSPYTMENLWDE